MKGRGPWMLRAFAAVSLIAAAAGFWGWNTAFRPNSLAADGRFVLKSKSSTDSTIQQLFDDGRIRDASSFQRYLSWRGWRSLSFAAA